MQVFNFFFREITFTDAVGLEEPMQVCYIYIYMGFFFCFFFFVVFLFFCFGNSLHRRRGSSGKFFVREITFSVGRTSKETHGVFRRSEHSPYVVGSYVICPGPVADRQQCDKQSINTAAVRC